MSAPGRQTRAQPSPPGGGATPRAQPSPPGGADTPPDELTEYQLAIVAVVSGLSAGEVVTYAEVAVEAGRPGSAQAVANVLRRVPGLPWWRVVPSGGRVYRTHAPVQVPLLRAEGVVVDEDGRIGSPGA